MFNRNSVQDTAQQAILIQRTFRHFLVGKQKRTNMLYKYNKLYYFKPFVIAHIFDTSELYKYRKNNYDFLNQVIRHLTVLHDRREEDENTSTLLTERQGLLFTKWLKKENTPQSNRRKLTRNVLKKLLNTLSIQQLSFIR
jgi:hypothetical protein